MALIGCFYLRSRSLTPRSTHPAHLLNNPSSSNRRWVIFKPFLKGTVWQEFSPPFFPLNISSWSHLTSLWMMHIREYLGSGQLFKYSDYWCVQEGVINCGLNCFFPLNFRSSSLIEAYVSLGKNWLVNLGLLAVHLFNVSFVFLSDSLPAAAKWAAGLGDVFHRLASTVPGWMDKDRATTCHEALPGLLHAKRSRQRSPAGSSLANMASNPQESRILLRTAGWSEHCWPGLNLLEDIFSIRICQLDPGDWMLSQKLLVDVRVDSFVYIHKACHSFHSHHFFPPFGRGISPVVIKELFHFEHKAPADTKAWTDLLMVMSHAELWAVSWQQALIHGDWWDTTPPLSPHFTIDWSVAYRILLILPLTAP
jgi:hypothetical protein